MTLVCLVSVMAASCSANDSRDSAGKKSDLLNFQCLMTLFGMALREIWSCRD